jgi:formylmethanofuran--tetrahydromethanopterin N-formyltransferase
LNIGSTAIDDTFAEAFGMNYTRLVVTAHDDHWLEAAVREFTGYSSSVIGCDLEIGIETRLGVDQTPDGRPGVAVLCFAFSNSALAKAVPVRVGQCLMTCPSTAVYDGLTDGASRIPLGKHLRYFGDGFQKSKMIGRRRYWRVPVMDGEFLVEDTAGAAAGVAGGNLIVQSASPAACLEAVRRAVAAIEALPGVITPFPGGVARSGSKVGSRYKTLKASRGRVDSRLHPDAQCALEIVVDGIDRDAVARAMSAAMLAAVGERIVAVSAGNYGGKLGKYHFHLHQLVPATVS